MTISTNDLRKIIDSVCSVLSSDYYRSDASETDQFINDMLIGFRSRNLNIEVANSTANVDHPAGIALVKPKKPMSTMAKLSETEVREIRASKESSAALGRRYSVSDAAIAKVRSYETYQHVEQSVE